MRQVFSQTGIEDGLFRIPERALTDFYLTSKHFEPLLESTFLVGKSKMRLVQVTDLSNKTNSLSGFYGDSFSLVFEGPADIPAASYLVKHPAIGGFPFLVNPAGKRSGVYEIVVNRIRR